MTSEIASRPRSLHSRVLSSLILVLAGILLAAALAEGILRLYPGFFSIELQQIISADPGNYGVAHPYIGNLGTPNSTIITSGRDFRAITHTDHYGFHNIGPWPEKAEIVALGDSVTAGFGVDDEQAWPAIVAKALPYNRLLNLGMVGAGAQQYLRIYETFGTRLHPKVLLVGFLLRNDFWDDDMFDRWLKSGAGANYMVWRDFGRPKSTSLSPGQPISSLITSLLWRGRLLASRSHLFQLLIYARSQLHPEWGPSKPTIYQAANGARLELDPDDFAAKTNYIRSDNPVFSITVDALRRLHDIARKDGTRVLVILQPSKEEVYLPLMGESKVDADPGRPLRTKLDSLGIPYLDLLPEFRNRAAKGEVLFFEADGHPNAHGYALIAEVVLAHLKENGKVYSLKERVP